MLNKFTKVSHTFQLFIHATNITNFWLQQHNHFLKCIEATDQWHRQLDWAYESAVCPLIIARVLIQFPTNLFGKNSSANAYKYGRKKSCSN